MSDDMTDNRMTFGPGSGGFRGDAVYERMSPQVLVTVRDSLWADERRAAIDEKERRERAAAFEEASIRASVHAAAMRGEHIDPREAARGIGRTHREVLEEAVVRMDLEDRRELMRRAREGAHITDLDWSDMHSADTSAPDIYSDAAKAEQARIAAQVERGRDLRHEERRTARTVRAMLRIRGLDR